MSGEMVQMPVDEELAEMIVSEGTTFGSWVLMGSNAFSSYAILKGIQDTAFDENGLIWDGEAGNKFLYHSLYDTPPDETSYADYIPSTGIGIYTQVLDFNFDTNPFFETNGEPQVLYNTVQHFSQTSPAVGYEYSATSYGAGIQYSDQEQQGLENQYGSIPDGLSVESYIDSSLDLMAKDVLQTFVAQELAMQKVDAPRLQKANITGFNISEAEQGVSVQYSTSTTTTTY